MMKELLYIIERMLNNMKVKTNILIITLLILLFNLGLIARIDNIFLTDSYIIILLILVNKIRKRYGIEVK